MPIYRANRTEVFSIRALFVNCQIEDWNWFCDDGFYYVLVLVEFKVD